MYQVLLIIDASTKQLVAAYSSLSDAQAYVAADPGNSYSIVLQDQAQGSLTVIQ